MIWQALENVCKPHLQVYVGELVSTEQGVDYGTFQGGIVAAGKEVGFCADIRYSFR
jgi:hypothetical protein